MANRRPLVLVDGRRKELPFVDSLPGSLIEAYQGRNHIINGGLDLWQRGSNATVPGYQAVDRFVHNVGGNSAASMSRIALLPEDFPAGVFSPSNACRIVINSNGTDTVNNFITLQHRAENVARFSNRLLHYGMWVRVNNPGLKVVFEATADPGAGGASNGGLSNTIGVKTFTIAQANVWTFCPNPFQFPTVRGFSIVSPELSSLRYNIWMSAGTAHNSRNQNLGFQPVNSVFDFAMMQLEYGSAPSPFEVSPMAAIIAACQRYYEKSYDLSVIPGGAATAGRISRSNSAAVGGINFQNYAFKVPKRVTPAVSIYNPATGAAGRVQQDSDSDVLGSIINIGQTGFEVAWTNTVSRWGGWIHFAADAEI